MTSKTLSESEKESFYAKIKEEGLTQSAFCKRYGLNQGNLSNCLKNDYGSPKSVEAVRSYISSDASSSPLPDSELPPSPYKSPKVKKSAMPSSISSKPVKSRAKDAPSKNPTPSTIRQEEEAEEDSPISNKEEDELKNTKRNRFM
jgi:transposase-like protein